MIALNNYEKCPASRRAQLPEGRMLVRKEPLESGRETEIDMIEREMEGGVVVVQPLDVYEHLAGRMLGGRVEIEGEIDMRKGRSGGR